MAGPQNAEKNREIQEQGHVQEHVEQLIPSDVNAIVSDAVPEETKHEKRIRSLMEGMKEFSDLFRSEWEKEDVNVGSELIRKSVDLAAKSSYDGFKSSYSIKTVAGGNESYKTDEKRSDTAVDLMDCLEEWNEIVNDKSIQLKPEEYVNKLYELAQVSQNYCLTHDSLVFWTSAGKGRFMIAKKIRNMAMDCLKGLLTWDDMKVINDNDGADMLTGETLDGLKKELKKNAEAYLSYRVQVAKACQGSLTGEILEKKMRVLRPLERQIRIYRSEVPEEKRDKYIREMIADYEECLAWERLRALTRKEGQKEDGLDEMIDQHLEKEAEIESMEKDKLVFSDKNEGLTPEQLRGIEEIDGWVLRNFRNGGIVGGIIPPLKNKDEEFINGLMSLTKRERLHVYYLVEKNKRKVANIGDVGMSQTYEPNLKAFKDQMLASKAKFWKRVLGGYTYMDKLSDALLVVKKFRKEIRAVADIESEQKSEKPENKEEINDPATERYLKLMELKKALEEFNRNVKAASKVTDKKKKPFAEEICNESFEYCKQLKDQLIALDDKVRTQDIYMSKTVSNESEVGEGAANYKSLGILPGLAQTGVIKGGGFLKAGWNLKSANWSTTNLWTGSFGEAASGVASMIGVVTTMITLCKTGDGMSGAEVAEKTMEIGNSLITVTGNALNMKGLIETGGSIAANAPSKELMTTYVATAGAVIHTGIALARAAGAHKMEVHGKNAGEYFKQKREKLEKLDEDQLTKEQKRELKYEKNMMKLQEKLREREAHRAIYSSVSAGLSLVTAAFPAFGFITAVGSIVTSIADSVEVSKIRTQLFDSFFNLDELAEKVTEKRYSGKRKNNYYNTIQPPKERVKAALRLRVAARAGFHDMKSAAVFVCSKFAGLIRAKLFGENVDEKERDGYIEFVKALNIRYNKEKKLPDEHTLVRKLTAQ